MKRARSRSPIKWRPVMYATYYPGLVKIARRHGYALALHGSLRHDFDLIAIPWIDKPLPIPKMLVAMMKYVGFKESDGLPYHSTSIKPQGRVAYTIMTGGGGYLDISVTPSTAEQRYQERIAAERRLGYERRVTREMEKEVRK